MPPTPQVHHVALTVTDLQRSTAWYQRVFDITEVVRPDAAAWERVLLRTSGVNFSLTAHHTSDAEDRFDPTRVGLDHLAISCRSRAELEAWMAHLDGLGIDHSPVRETPTAHLATCHDPDGIALEFFWPVS